MKPCFVLLSVIAILGQVHAEDPKKAPPSSYMPVVMWEPFEVVIERDAANKNALQKD